MLGNDCELVQGHHKYPKGLGESQCVQLCVCVRLTSPWREWSDRHRLEGGSSTLRGPGIGACERLEDTHTYNNTPINSIVMSFISHILLLIRLQVHTHLINVAVSLSFCPLNTHTHPHAHTLGRVSGPWPCPRVHWAISTISSLGTWY